jgi:type VI protein secretion system component VasK
MWTKTHLAFVELLLLIVLTGCGPGPALGLGPALDPLVSVVLVIALIIGGYWVVKSAANSPTVHAIGKQFSATEKSVRDYAHERTEPSQPPSAEDTLRQRYARGEIDRKQYLEMMEDLKKK